MKARIIVEDIVDGKVVRLADMSTTVTHLAGSSVVGWAAEGIFALTQQAVEAEFGEEEKPTPATYTATLTNAGETSIHVIKELRGFSNLPLKEAKDAVDAVKAGGTLILKTELKPDEAVAIKKQFEAVGATVEIT